MNAIAGAILVLAASILVHAAANDHRGYDGFAVASGVVVGLIGLVVTLTSIFPRRQA